MNLGTTAHHLLDCYMRVFQPLKGNTIKQKTEADGHHGQLTTELSSSPP
jgi:hypothetical protein